MRALGVDLSATPGTTAVCAVDWSAGTVELLPRPLSDEQIVVAVRGSDLAAIDVPLGWPDAFVAAVGAHHDGGGWPPAHMVPPADRFDLRYRLTDRVVIAGGAQPLSVSSDRIGVAAMRGARLQHLLRLDGTPVDRSGTTGRVIEAYPAAALRAWGFASSGSGYKTKDNAVPRAALVASLLPRLGAVGVAATERLAGCDDDDFDALLCAVVARAAAFGLTTPPTSEQIDSARREGWIHVPSATLEAVLDGTLAPG